MGMEAGEVWYIRTTGDERVASIAFAAAGALTAAEWNPRKDSADKALADIIDTSGSSPISWKHPSPSLVRPRRSITDEKLVEAWQAAFERSSTKANARLVVDTTYSAAAAATASEFISTCQTLIDPWLGQSAETWPGQVVSVAFTSFQAARSHTWNWPLRFGMASSKNAARSKQLTELRGVRYDYLSVMPPSAADADFMLIAAPTVRRLDTLREKSIGLAVARTSADMIAGKRNRLFQYASTAGSVPTVFVDVPEQYFGKVFENFTDELSHNKNLDIALFNAHRNFRRPGSQPPILFLPRTDLDEVLSGIRPTSGTMRLRDRLRHLPRDAFVGAPPDHANAIGIARDARTVGDYLENLTQAIDEDRLVFSSERHAQALSLTTKKIDSLEEQLSTKFPHVLRSSIPVGWTPSGGPPPPPRATSRPGDGPVPAPFSAFARLDAPDIVTAGQPFDFEVGFGEHPDPRSDSESKSAISISDAKSGENILVLVAAENGKILSTPNYKRLELQLDARTVFKVLPAADAPFVRLSAEYLFRNEPVGSIVRTLAIAGRTLPEQDQTSRDLFSPLMKAIAAESLDLVLIVKHEEKEKITWQAVDRMSGRISDPIPVSIGDAKQFAGKLDAEQRAYGYKGYFAKAIIETTGRLIAKSCAAGDPGQIPCTRYQRGQGAARSDTDQ